MCFINNNHHHNICKLLSCTENVFGKEEFCVTVEICPPFSARIITYKYITKLADPIIYHLFSCALGVGGGRGGAGRIAVVIGLQAKSERWSPYPSKGIKSQTGRSRSLRAPGWGVGCGDKRAPSLAPPLSCPALALEPGADQTDPLELTRPRSESDGTAADRTIPLT